MGYKLKTTKDDLYNKGFHYNKLMSDSEIDCYSIRFPVLKYEKITTVECELTVELQTGNVIINVFNYGTNDLYAPYYHHEFGRYKTVEEIQNAISTYAKSIGLNEVKNKRRRKKK